MEQSLAEKDVELCAAEAYAMAKAWWNRNDVLKDFSMYAILLCVRDNSIPLQQSRCWCRYMEYAMTVLKGVKQQVPAHSQPLAEALLQLLRDARKLGKNYEARSEHVCLYFITLIKAARDEAVCPLQLSAFSAGL